MAFTYRLLPPRRTFPQDMSPEETEVMGRHVGYWQDLLDRKVAVALGPVLNPEDPWGLGLLDAEDGEEAEGIAAADPAVSSGTCTYELLPMQLVRPA